MLNSVYVAVMTPKQLENIRKSLGLTKSQFSRLIGVNRSTVTRWESGEVEIPGIAAIAIRATAEAGKNARHDG